MELESLVTFGRMAAMSNFEPTTEGRGVYPKGCFPRGPVAQARRL